MSLTARTLADTLRLAAEEARTLRPFIDDLDGWDGKDLDTGSNAVRTLGAMSQALSSLSDHTSFALAVEMCGDVGVREGVGHCGQMLTILLHSWANALEGADKLTAVVLRRMLKSSLSCSSAHMEFSPALRTLMGLCAAELDDCGPTLPDEAELINLFASQCQFAMVEATNQSTGRIDPGAAVLALFFTCLDAVVRDDISLLESFAQMLSELSASHQQRGPRAHAPGRSRAFTVDMIVSGTRADVDAICERLTLLGAAYSYVGREDFFGVGEWRFHIDTSAPLAIYPRGISVRSFTVNDARPDEMLGVDGLAEGFVHRGVQILERPSVRRPERAHVVVMTNAPGMLEMFAQAGATVVLHPNKTDQGVFSTLAQGSSTGVTLFIPTDQNSHALAVKLSEHCPAGMRFLVADTCDELSALQAATATATTFVPQPGGFEAADALFEILTQALEHAHASARSIELATSDVELMSQAVESLLVFGARSFRLLLSKSADPQTAAIIQHFLPIEASASSRSNAYAGVAPVTLHEDDHNAQSPYDVIEGQYSGATLLQGIQ